MKHFGFKPTVVQTQPLLIIKQMSLEKWHLGEKQHTD